MSQPNLDQLCINTIRTLAIDAVQQANSGHPGAPMGLAPVVYELWHNFLNYDPADPLWPNRDRFVLSAGHASMLLYATLHLAGVRAANAKGEILKEAAVSLDDIKRFRQLDSRTPGHPESHLTTGVETTTGPLGQGVGNSVGMAIAGKWLASNFNKPGFDLFNFRVWAVCGDGDIMEGVAGEAAFACTNCFSVPRAQNGVGLTWATLQANPGVNNIVNPYSQGDILPAQDRNSGTITFDQNLFDGISFFADAFYSNRRLTQTAVPGAKSRLTASARRDPGTDNQFILSSGRAVRSARQL